MLFAIGGDAPHQIKRQGLIQRELHRALAEFVCAELSGKDLDPLRTGIKADVVFKRGEVDDVALEEERRYAVGYLLRGFGEDFEDRVAHLVQLRLHLRREAEDVVGDGGRGIVGHRFFTSRRNP